MLLFYLLSNAAIIHTVKDSLVNKYLHDVSMLALFLRVSTVGLPFRLANIYVKMQKDIRIFIVSYEFVLRSLQRRDLKNNFWG
jgi:hypothetical protein